MITYATLLMILTPIALAMFFYILRLEKALVKIQVELKHLQKEFRQCLPHLEGHTP